MGKGWLGALLLSAVLGVMTAFAAPSEKRIALVIGNSAYRNTPALLNPVNDAADLAASLKRVGFDVILERDLDKRSMELAIGRFARIAQDADTALFFYAGHGIQYRGLNYLVPTDASLEDEFSLNFDVTRVDDVLFALERAHGIKILILDACRDNPLLDRLTRTAATRDLLPSKGLAKIEPTRGMVIAYSTQANQIAVDGGGRNSPFASALMKEIEEPGVEIGTLFRRVAADVHRATQGKQLPELSISLVGEYYINTRETDLQAWAKIRDSGNPDDLANFITRYPVSVLVHDARQRLASLEQEKARAAREAAERERRERLLRDQEAREQAEKERLARAQAEKLRQEQERLAREKAEREKLEQDRLGREELDRQRLAREQDQREAAEREKLERDRLAQEQAAREDRERQSAAQRDDGPDRIRPGLEAPAVQTAMLPPAAEPSSAKPASPPALSGSELVREIKKELKRVGCYAGRIDDKWTGAETKASVANFVRHASLKTDPHDPTIELLDAVRGTSQRVCPLECGAQEVEKNGRCIAKERQTDRTKSVPGAAKRQLVEKKSTGRKCFVFNGQSFCEQTH